VITESPPIAPVVAFDRCPRCGMLVLVSTSDDEGTCEPCQRQLVAFIRTTCARELSAPYAFPFFNRNYHLGEMADDALLRLFYQQKRHEPTPSDLHVVLVLCHG